jgi:hypothetical protein
MDHRHRLVRHHLLECLPESVAVTQEHREQEPGIDREQPRGVLGEPRRPLQFDDAGSPPSSLPCAVETAPAPSNRSQSAALSRGMMFAACGAKRSHCVR